MIYSTVNFLDSGKLAWERPGNFSAGGWLMFGKLRLKPVRGSCSEAMGWPAFSSRSLPDKDLTYNWTCKCWGQRRNISIEKLHHSLLPNWVKGNGFCFRNGKWAVLQGRGRYTLRGFTFKSLKGNAWLLQSLRNRKRTGLLFFIVHLWTGLRLKQRTQCCDFLRVTQCMVSGSGIFIRDAYHISVS